MSHGLKGKVKEIVLRMDALRSDRERARNINLRTFLAENYTGGDGNPLEPGHLYSELGIEPSYTRTKDLYADEDTKYLVAEIVRDGVSLGMGLAQREQMADIRQRLASHAPITSEAGGQRFISPEAYLEPTMRGAVQATYYPDLVVRDVPVPSPDVRMPFMNLSDARLVDSDEGVTIEEGTVTYGTKPVTIRKRARGIKITDEAVMFNTLDLVSLFFLDYGRQLGSTLNGDAVKVILDGDQADGSEAAVVIGVADTVKGVQYEDVLTAWVQLALLGRMSTSILANARMAVKYLTLEAVWKRQNAGATQLPTNIKLPLPTQQDLYPSAKVPPRQLVFQDSSMSLVQLTAMPLMVERERIASKQINGTFASIYTGFAKLQRNASLVIDETLAFADNGFPDWLQPFEG